MIKWMHANNIKNKTRKIKKRYVKMQNAESVEILRERERELQFSEIRKGVFTFICDIFKKANYYR